MTVSARTPSGRNSHPKQGEAAAVAARPRPGPESPSQPLSRRAYYVYLARATFALALGVALLLSGSGLSNLATFIAVYWILAAVVTLRWVGVHHEVKGRRSGLLAGTMTSRARPTVP